MILRLLLYILLGMGLAFNAIGVLGLLRFPDVYTRLHAATKCTTMGSMSIALAVMGYGLVKWHRSSFNDPYGLTFATHTFLALLALLVTNPTGAHALARAAHRCGIRPYKMVVDRLEEVGK